MFRNKTLITIFLIVFVDLIGFGILIPVLPFILTIKNLGGVPNPEYLLSQDTSISTGYIILGLLLASYAFGQFLATPILGQLSDKYGRKLILIMSLSGTVISYLIFGYGILTKNLLLLFVARFADGITGGNISVAQAVIADISNKENRAKNFGLIGAAFGLGFILGPYIGGKLSDSSISSSFNSSTPFWFAALLSLINVFLVVILLKETNKNMNANSPLNWSKSFSNIYKALTLKGIKVQLTASFFYNFGFTFFTSFAGTYFVEKFLFTQSNIGDFYAVIGFWVAFSQAVITRRLSHIAEYKILRVSYFLAGIAILGFVFAPSFASDNWLGRSWTVFLVIPIFAAFVGLSQSNSTALISKSVEPSRQGEIMGINSSVQALAQTIPSVLSGFVASSFVSTQKSTFLQASSYPLIFATISILIAGLVFCIYYKPKQPSLPS